MAWTPDQVYDCLAWLKAMRSDNPGGDLRAYIAAGCDAGETVELLKARMAFMAQQLRQGPDITTLPTQ